MSDKPATIRYVATCFFILLIWLTVEHWLYWRPTYHAVQRIEQRIEQCK